MSYNHWTQWRIQDFPQEGGPTPKIAIIFQIFAENCMKMKEFGPPGGASLVPPLDPPMSKNIIAGFRKTGIYPHDPQVIPAESLAVADLGGCTRRTPPYGPKFSRFHAVFRKI